MGEKGQDSYKPPEGFEGNLTDEQTEKLKEIWKSFFAVIGKGESGAGVAGTVEADENADADGAGDQDPDKGKQGKEAFGDKAKDDAAKDAQHKEREKKETAKLLGTHSKEELRRAFWDGSRGETPDALMLRFLRARKWDVERAFAMLASVGKWRLDMDVEGIKKLGEEGLCKEDGFLLQLDSGKVYIQGTDKQDRPVVYIHVAKHKIGEQSQKALQRFTVYGIESAKSLLTPRSNGQGCIVFDLTNFGLSNMDWQCLRFLIEVFEARYPETLGVFCMHKAPMIINPIWAIIKPLLDPVVRDKIVFTYTGDDLAEYIPRKHIEKHMGGEADMAFSYTKPVEGENKRMQEDSEEKTQALKAWDEATEYFEELTERWINGDEEAGKERATKGNDVIMIRHYDSDAFVRAQTMYSRSGTAVGDGRVRWQYPDHEDEFGMSYDGRRKEYGIEGQCPRNGPADGPVAAAQKALDESKKPDAAAAHAEGKEGGSGLGRLRRRSSNTFSKVTPGASLAEQAREKAEADIKRKERDLDKAKKKEEEAEAQRKKEQDEEKKQEAANKPGIIGSVTGTASWAATGVLSTAQSTVHTAAGYVPNAVGGEKLRTFTSPKKGGNSEGDGKKQEDQAQDSTANSRRHKEQEEEK